MGEEALRRHLEGRLRPHGPSSWAEALAYEVTRSLDARNRLRPLGLDMTRKGGWFFFIIKKGTH